jgi:hypothetical protein
MNKPRIRVLILQVDVTADDIAKGECRIPSKCMEKVAIARSMIEKFGNLTDAQLHVRVDAGHINLNWEGYRRVADTPKIAKASLIRFDQKKPVAPHSYTLHFRRTTKVVKVSRDRQDQINERRRVRASNGAPDKVANRLTLHRRVVGYA